MDFDLNAFFKTEEFNSLDDESKEQIKEFVGKVSGKSQTEALAVFMEYREKLSFDKTKQKALSDALRAGLSPENRVRFETMERFINSRG